ncbi:MAG: VOC family protein [Candidatus Tectomicrobia bacterium]|nr:VOC family protein [Candidatus Tectomicrobia bacterium]
MIKLDHFHHATLPITDKGRADAFYEELLGFHRLPRPQLSFDGTWLRLGDMQLHLVVVDEEEMRTLRQGRQAVRHLAFMINDYDATKQALQDAGMPFRESVAGTNRQLFCQDPDGNVLEFIHPGPA